MLDNEIVEALERLKNTKDYLKEQYQEQVKKCPYPELKPIAKQTYEDNKKAFDIAIKAIEEFNRLQAKVIKEQNKNSKLRNERNRLQAEIERLEKDSKRLKKVEMQLDDAMKMYDTIKSEAYKEFAEKVKQGFFSNSEQDVLICGVVDNILKEMAGEN